MPLTHTPPTAGHAAGHAGGQAGPPPMSPLISPAGEALFAVAGALDTDLARPEERYGALTVTVRPGEAVGGTLYIAHAGAVLALCLDTTACGSQVRVRCYGPRDFHVMRREVVDRLYRARAAGER